MLNEFQIRAMVSWATRAKTEYEIALAARRTYFTITDMYKIGLLNQEETIELLDELWGDTNG